MLEWLLVTTFLVASPADPSESPKDAEAISDPWSVLAEDGAEGSPREAMRRMLRERVERLLEARTSAFERIHSSEDARAYQAQRLRVLRALLSGGFERTPLRARTIGEQRRLDGYRLERVIFESQPGFFVTGNVYLPEAPGPHPGVLFSCGHWESGKAEESYQRTCALLARAGFVTLAYDPIGQGERKQLLDESGEMSFRATSEHLLGGVAPVVFGSDLAAYMLWDAQRALDYLASRSDVDASRLGATGNSGGGMMTSYLMAVDERVACAAPGCFITATVRKNVRPGPGDTEQILFGRSLFGLDFADYALLRAPRPTLLLCASRDYVPVLGTWEAFREAKRFYGQFGFPERVDLVEADAKHGFSPLLRVGMVRWMRRWLRGIDAPFDESEIEVLGEEKLRCTPGGRVTELPGARGLHELYRERFATCEAERAEFWRVNGIESVRAILRSVVGVDSLSGIGLEIRSRRGSVERESYDVHKVVLERDDGILLPALALRPHGAVRGPYLALLGEGKSAAVERGGEIEKLVLAGHPVLAVDLRGLGETAIKPWRYRKVSDYLGPNAAEFFAAFLCGESWLGMRTEDVLACARFAGELVPRDPGRGPAASVSVLATGEAALAALHAAAFEPSLFSKVRVRGAIDSWRVTIEAPLAKNLMIQTVYAAARYYDIPDLLRLAGPGKVQKE